MRGPVARCPGWKAGALSLFWAWGCGAAPVPAPPPAPSPSASPVPSGLPQLGPSSITSRGKTPWRLESERVEYDPERKTAQVGRLTWSLLDERGEPSVRVEGAGASVDTERERVTFQGLVHMFGPQGEELLVQRLVWDGQEGVFLGSRGVRLTRESSVMTGDRLRASPDLRRVTIAGDVRVDWRGGPPDGGAGR